jgi:ribosomal protein L11 methylase PrmA
VVDPPFRQRLLADPQSAARGCPLTADDQAVLAALSAEQLYAWVGERMLHQIVPIQASPRFTIVPAHYPPAPNHIALIPDATFGNGTHDTTRLSLGALERHLRPDGEVLTWARDRASCRLPPSGSARRRRVDWMSAPPP